MIPLNILKSNHVQVVMGDGIVVRILSDQWKFVFDPDYLSMLRRCISEKEKKI